VIAKPCNDGIYPNHTDIGVYNGYKEKIIDIIHNEGIKLLIDLHGLKADRATDIDIITHYGMTIGQDKNIIDELKKCFKENDILNVTEDKYYFAESEQVIVHNIWNISKIPSIELEINWHYRNISEPINLIKTFNSLEKFISNYII